MKRMLRILLDTGTNAIGRIKYNRYKLLTFVLAALVIANALGITGWTVNTITGLEINLPELAWAAGDSCKPDGKCNATNESDCLANKCCAWENNPGKGGPAFCYCSCPEEKPYCVRESCVECRNKLDCVPSKPVCDANECKTCIEINPEKPYYEEGVGCVECLEDGHCDDSAKPVCNSLTFSCVSCASIDPEKPNYIDGECVACEAPKPSDCHECKQTGWLSWFGYGDWEWVEKENPFDHDCVECVAGEWKEKEKPDLGHECIECKDGNWAEIINTYDHDCVECENTGWVSDNYEWVEKENPYEHKCIKCADEAWKEATNPYGHDCVECENSGWFGFGTWGWAEKENPYGHECVICEESNWIEKPGKETECHICDEEIVEWTPQEHGFDHNCVECENTGWFSDNYEWVEKEKPTDVNDEECIMCKAGCGSGDCDEGDWEEIAPPPLGPLTTSFSEEFEEMWEDSMDKDGCEAGSEWEELEDPFCEQGGWIIENPLTGELRIDRWEPGEAISRVDDDGAKIYPHYDVDLGPNERIVSHVHTQPWSGWPSEPDMDWNNSKVKLPGMIVHDGVVPSNGRYGFHHQFNCRLSF